MRTDDFGFGDFEDHAKTRFYNEHAQRWAECLLCGRLWSIHECEDTKGNEYLEAEVITEGDESCLDRKP
jgi:hypothetical protein